MKFRWRTRKLAALPILDLSRSPRFVSTGFARFARGAERVSGKFAVSSTAKDMLNIKVMAALILGLIERIRVRKDLESTGLDNAWLIERRPDGVGSWFGCNRGVKSVACRE